MTALAKSMIFVIISTFFYIYISSESTNDQILCKKNVNGPEFIPNIFYCNSTQYCCNQDGFYACCSREISPEDVKDQLILWCCIIGVVVVFALAVGCYFQDRYCCDKNRKIVDDEETYRVCFCCKKKIDYRKKPKLSETLFPDETGKNRVSDPIYGDVLDA